jgi:hypothetical protein
MSQNLSEKYTQEIIGNILNFQHTWQWVGYVAVPVLLYISTTLIALSIYLVVWLYYLNETNGKAKFSDMWRIVLFAQWSSIVAMFVKIVWFGLFRDHYSLTELQSFYPLSLINCLDIKNVASWFAYPLQLVNPFELAYWVILVIGIKKLLHRSWLKSAEMVCLSYGSLMLVWIVVVMFITLNLSH